MGHTQTEIDSHTAKDVISAAMRAPSGHNTQPWKFTLSGDTITVSADLNRALPVADPDRRELFISVGCALENLLIAAEHHGFGHTVEYGAEAINESPLVTVSLTAEGVRSPFRPDTLYDAIADRHTNHRLFNERPIPEADVESLEGMVVEDGITVHMIRNGALKTELGRLVGEADVAQFADPAWRRELGYWLGKGVFGTPPLIAKIAKIVVTHLDMGKGTAKKDVELFNSAPVIGIVAAQKHSPKSWIRWVRTGRAYERMALAATGKGIATHPMSQLLEVPDVKEKMTNLLSGYEGTPQHVFRMGYADPERKRPPRRPLESVLDTV